MKTCPKCQAQNRDGARFCQHCSAPLVAELVCPSCGTGNPTSARFCHHCATPLRGQTPPTGLTGLLPVNTLLSERYTLIRKLGRGGMGAVYLASDARLAGKYWAVKEMSDASLVDPLEKQKAVEVFRREATMLADLNHPNLTKVVDYFEDRGKHFLVMDFVDGQTLDEMLEGRRTPFAEAQVLGWAEQLCDVLIYLHNQTSPIIFRDLKPTNIMVGKDGRLHLIDFGIARLFKPGKSRDTANFGTAGYAPPEQYGKGQTDARSDVYALGATLHHLLTLRDPGDEPFKFPPVKSLNPSVSLPVSEAIMKAVKQEPGERWQSILQMRQALKAPPSPPPAPVYIPPSPVIGYSSSIASPAVAPAPKVAPRPVALAAPPAPVKVYPSLVARRSSFGGYLLIVGILLALRYGMFKYSYLFYGFGTTGEIIYFALIGITELLAPVLTHRPLAGFLTYLLPYYAFPESFSAWLAPYIGSALTFEAIFAIGKYNRYSFWVLLFAEITSAAAFDVIASSVIGDYTFSSDYWIKLVVGIFVAVLVTYPLGKRLNKI